MAAVSREVVEVASRAAAVEVVAAEPSYVAAEVAVEVVAGAAGAEMPLPAGADLATVITVKGTQATPLSALTSPQPRSDCR